MARQQAMQYAHYAHAAIKRHIIKIYINEGSMLHTSFITCPLSNIEIISEAIVCVNKQFEMPPTFSE